MVMSILDDDLFTEPPIIFRFLFFFGEQIIISQCLLVTGVSKDTM